MREKEQNKSSRIIVSIICLFCLSVLATKISDPSNQQETYADCSARADEIYTKAHNEVVTGIKLETFSERQANQTRIQASQQHLENIVLCNDLDAQQAMSARTHWGLFVGIWGLIAIIATLWQTQNATRAANKTLIESMNMTALVMQEQRPWIYIERSVECDLVFNNNGGVRLTWFKTIQNIGKTPAYDFHFAQQLIETENIFHNDKVIETFKAKLIEKIGGWGGEIIIPNQPNRNEPSFGQINSLLEFIEGEGDEYMLLTGCFYSLSLEGPIGYDIQIYSVRPRRIGGDIGPMVYELIHNQYSRQVK